MANSIRLHPKHGLNPTVPVCFFCGKPKHEVALLGAAYKSEAPMHMLLDDEPCDECLAGMAQGITLLGSSDTPRLPGQRPKGKDETGKPVYLTGAFVVVTEGFIDRAFQPNTAAEILKSRKACVDNKIVLDLAAYQNKEGAE